MHLWKGFAILVLPLWLMLQAQAEVQSIGVAGDGEFTRITLTSHQPLNPDIFLRDTEDGMLIEMVPEALYLAETPFFAEPTGGIFAYTLEADRIIFELDRPMMIMREIDLPPAGSEQLYRFILDLSGVSQARFQMTAQRDASRFAKFEAERFAAAEAQRLAPTETLTATVTEPPPAGPEAPSAKPAGYGA